MSVENGKVCCNCRHCIRDRSEGYCKCICEVMGHQISYIQVMTGWCRHWATDAKKWEEVEE